MMPDGGPITYKIILQKCQNDEPYKTEVIHLKTDKAFQKVKELATAQNALEQIQKELHDYNMGVNLFDAILHCNWKSLLWQHNYQYILYYPKLY